MGNEVNWYLVNPKYPVVGKNFFQPITVAEILILNVLANLIPQKVKVLVAPLCLTICDPTDYSLPGSPVQEILQARILGRY